MSAASNIVYLTGKNEQETVNNGNNLFINLGINTRTGALLLNSVLHFLADIRPYCVRRHYGDGQKGGGLFCKGEARISINDCDEVGLFFNSHWGVSRSLRVAPMDNFAETSRVIKNKLADALKKMWQAKAKGDGTQNSFMPIKKTYAGKLSTSTYDKDEYVIPFTAEEQAERDKTKGYDKYEPTVSISLNQYRCLYEYLKGRNTDKTIEKYGKAAYDSIIGQKTTDQFVISAMEVIKAEIKKVTEEYDLRMKTTNDDYQKQIYDLRKKAEEAQKELVAERDAKYAELRDQLKELSGFGLEAPNPEAAD